MTNTELIQKIKVEINKRYAKYREKMKSDDFTYYEGMADALDLFEQFIDSIEKECEDFPTTDEEMAKFLATHPKVEVPEKYKTPDWMFEESEKPINPADAMKEIEEKIALVKQRGSWDGVDVDKFMDEVRGREPVCEELEKELDEFLKDHVFGKLINRNAGLALARHFVEWQSKQDKETIELAEDHAYLAGAVNEREQMMKEAVKMYPCYDEEHNLIGFSTNYEAKGAYGQLTRIIIEKED